MFELVQVNEKTYYIESPAKIGVYVAGGADVYLIDSGMDSVCLSAAVNESRIVSAESQRDDQCDSEGSISLEKRVPAWLSDRRTDGSQLIALHRGQGSSIIRRSNLMPLYTP